MEIIITVTSEIMNAIQARKIYTSINRRTLSYTQLKTVFKFYTLSAIGPSGDG